SAAAAPPILPVLFRSFPPLWVQRGLWSRRRPVVFTIRTHFRGLRLELRAPRKESQQILERRDRDDRQPELARELLHRRALPASALHPIKRDQHASGGGAVRPDQLDRFALRPSVGDHIVYDQDTSLQRRSDDHAAFAVVLGLFAIETVPQIVPFF